MSRRRWRRAAMLAALWAPALLRGQDQPLSVGATFSTGYYSTSARGEINQSTNFVPFGAKLDADGFYGSPDLLNFSLRPELNAGPQASEAGFQGGNGVQLRLTFLRKLIPLTFRYSNLQMEDVYFGGLSQISGYSLKNRNREIGMTMELKHSNLPSTIIDWSGNSVVSQSATPGIPDYLAHGNHINMDSQYERWGWVLDGFAHRQQQDSDILEPVAGGTHFGTLAQTIVQYQASGRRGFGGDSELYLDAGRQSTASLLFDYPIRLATRYAGANLRLFQKRRWRTSLRAGYSSNLASQMLAVAAGSLAGANAIAADGNVLRPFAYGISNYNLGALTSATLAHGFGVYGSVERNAILSSNQAGPLNANYFTSSGGVTYTHKVSWGNLSGEYGREFGLGSITGQSGTIQGQTWRATVERGGSSGLQIDGTVRGADQGIHNLQPLSNNSVALEGSVADHLFGQLGARLGGGWQWSTIENSANQFRTNGYTARAALEHPRVQVSASLNESVSNSIPFLNDALAGLGLASGLFTPAAIIPSDYRSMNLTLHSNPMRKVELSAVWTRSSQHLDRILNNDFQSLNAGLTYHYRKIQIEFGYIRFDQIYAFYPNTLRSRFYVRVVRSAKLL